MLYGFKCSTDKLPLSINIKNKYLQNRIITIIIIFKISICRCKNSRFNFMALLDIAKYGKQ